MQKSSQPARPPSLDDALPVIHELSAYEEVIAIVLFGSLARRKAREISDIDLCVMTRALPEPIRMELLSYGSETIDISLFSDLPITIRFRVFNEGKVIFCRDRETFGAIRAATIREYQDTAPFIRRNYLRAFGIGRQASP